MLKNICKKFTAAFLSLALAVPAVLPAYAEEWNWNVRVNDAAVDFSEYEPIYDGNYTYLPVRLIFEQIGTVDWDEETKTVIITADENTAEIDTAAGRIYVNGNEIECELYDSDKFYIAKDGDYYYIAENDAEPPEPIIENGTVFMPLNSILEAMGNEYTVNGDDSIDIYSYSYKLDEFKESIAGLPLPQAIYNNRANIDETIGNSDYFDILIQYADTDGYDELVSAVKKLNNAYIGIFEDESEDMNYQINFLNAFSEFSYMYLNALDSLADKSFMTDFVRSYFENENVTIDESITDEECIGIVSQLIDEINNEYDGEKTTSAAVNSKFGLLTKYLLKINSMTKSDIVGEDDSAYEVYMLLYSVDYYVRYMASIDPQLNAIEDKLNTLFAS